MRTNSRDFYAGINQAAFFLLRDSMSLEASAEVSDSNVVFLKVAGRF